jgi:alpha-N-arabinofuranosidase
MTYHIKIAALMLGGLLAWAPALADEEASNPILSGFYPDPSICRVGDDYYLVTSTFEYFPGVPIFHSKDLVHWQQIGHCLTRPSQLPLDEMRASGGIFAPTLRWHDGTFYMITTNVRGPGHFYVTAADPAGPWSEPVWLEQEGIDPSLFFDDDGTVYYTRHVGGGDGYIGQRTLNLETGQLEGEMKNIWAGTGGVWAEGPHLYKVDGKYYLMISEGGTSYNHCLTIARSDSPWGPFESNPDNPILTHRGRMELPIQAVGHADLVETPAGWWAVCLGIRPQGGTFHHLGRETFLVPASWSDNDWLELGDNKTVELALPAPNLPAQEWPAVAERDEFDGPELGFCWNYLRNPHPENYLLDAVPGKLRLQGTEVSLNDVDSPTFVGRRQTALACEVSTSLAFDPQAENEEAGLVVRGNDENHFEIGITNRGGRQVFLRLTRDGEAEEPRLAEIGPGEVTLTIVARPLEYEFFYQVEGGERTSLGTAPTRDLSSETIGGFTGAYFAMYATGNGQPCSMPADFDWFDYRILER